MRRRSLPHVEPIAPRGARRLLLRAMGSGAVMAGERSLPFRLIVWRAAPFLLCLSGGRLAALLPFPAELLETRDPRNGRSHRRVVIYFHDHDRIIVAATRAGMATDPHWYRNALDAPDQVRFAGRPCRAAPVADVAEQTRLWSLADRVYPPHAAARAHTARAIPLLQLHTPTPSDGDGVRGRSD